MFGLGMGELLVILLIVLIMFGAGKLPKVGAELGEAIKNFRASKEHKIVEDDKKDCDSE